MNNTIKNQQDVQDKPETTDKNKNSLSSGRKSGLDFRKYTQQIWLAGLRRFFTC